MAAPLMFSALFPLEMQAQFAYAVRNNTVSIVGYTGPDGAVTIPGSVNGFPYRSA